MTILLPMDIHSHSEYSPDGDFRVSKMCESAVDKGLAVYAITDHYDINGALEDFSILDVYLNLSVTDTLSAKAQWKEKLLLLTGIELGQPLENQGKAEEVLQAHPFDLVLCSIHNTPGSPDFYYYKPGEDDSYWEKQLEDYFVEILAMISWGRFDAAAHLTYPFRYILQRRQVYPFHKWDNHLETVIKALAEKGLALEINTSGIDRNPPCFLPEARWVKRFRELGGEKLTLGADAHSATVC